MWLIHDHYLLEGECWLGHKNSLGSLVKRWLLHVWKMEWGLRGEAGSFHHALARVVKRSWRVQHRWFDREHD